MSEAPQEGQKGPRALEAAICGANKMGEFNMLKCFRVKGHAGPCNFCVADRAKGQP